MKISSIGVNNLQPSFYTMGKTKRKAPSFQADYDNRPVPPIGKAFAAASAIALISSMIYTSRCDNDDDIKNAEPTTEIFDDTLSHSEYHPIVYAEPIIDEPAPKPKPALADTIPTDTVQQDTTQHAKDSTIKSDDVNDLIHNGKYKIVAKGDTIELVPTSEHAKDSNTNTH